MLVEARTYGHMALWALVGIAWLILGANSDNVPWGTPNMWLVGCALVAGTAFGVAYRRTQDSMLIYLIAAFLIGGTRSIAYMVNGSGGPAWVWVIVTLTNVVLLTRWSERNS